MPRLPSKFIGKIMTPGRARQFRYVYATQSGRSSGIIGDHRNPVYLGSPTGLATVTKGQYGNRRTLSFVPKQAVRAMRSWEQAVGNKSFIQPGTVRSDALLGGKTVYRTYGVKRPLTKSTQGRLNRALSRGLSTAKRESKW